VTDDAIPQFGYPVGAWHSKFAWLPTDTFDCGTRWFCFVWRRRIQKKEHLFGGPDRWWQHRALPPSLASDQRG
jgi:hypothetical protein